MIRLRDVRKRLGEFELSVDLTVEPRTTLALIGPSGCGKSTLLRLAIGLLSPDAGEVLVDGEPITRERRRRVGYVIQEGGLFPHLTARDNVTLVARLNGIETQPRLVELCALVGLDRHQLSRYPAELSGGQRQRVGVMRALMLDPPVLLLDEPFGALDPQIRGQIQDEFGALFRRLGKATLLVTHDMAEAVRLADEIAVLRDGAIVQRAPIRELLDAPADPFVAEFIRAQRAPEALR